MAVEASTLWERMDGGFDADLSIESIAVANARLDRWLGTAAGGDRRVFERRLGWLGVSTSEVLPFLGLGRLSGALPPWTEVFARSMAAAADPIPAGSLLPASPFVDIVVPFGQAAQALLDARCFAVFSPSVLRTLVNELLEDLSFAASYCFYLEFCVHRATVGGSKAVVPGATEHYRSFCAALSGDGLWRFFAEYPVLARLLSTLVHQWATNVSGLAQHLERDRARLESVFGANRPLGPVVGVQAATSDRHDGGQKVMVLEFGGGVKVVHKPRNLGVEQAWFGLLAELNGQGGDFRVLRVLNCGGHGWVGFVDHEPCPDVDGLHHFYRRAGMLLGVLYAFDATDCFHENLIAAAGYPVLVDVETLMHGATWQPADLSERATTGSAIRSVLDVGMLPAWDVDRRGTTVDVSGLGTTVGQGTSYRLRRWSDMNCDAMALAHEPLVIRYGKHLPFGDAMDPVPADYADDIAKGFRAMYRVLRDSSVVPARIGDAMQRLGSQEIRLVVHSSVVYVVLLTRLHAPRHMRNGVDRSIEIDVLSRLYGHGAGSPPKEILGAEIEAIERLDIPRFTVRADEDAVRVAAGGPIEAHVGHSPWSHAQQRLMALDEDDLERQVALVRASLLIASADAVQEIGVPDLGPIRVPPGSALPREVLIGHAARIGRHLERNAFKRNDGALCWLGPVPLPGTNRSRIGPVGENLYRGRAGIALFFAALEAVGQTGRRTSLAALSELRARLGGNNGLDALGGAGSTLGAATGLGGLIYSLTRCGTLLGEPGLVDDAVVAAASIDAGLIDEDRRFDLLSGCAGAIVALLVLFQVTNDVSILETAQRCGRHLLRHRIDVGGGAGWPSGPDGVALTGLSHGSAGIALSLLRLADVTGDAAFGDAAHDAIDFEDSLFDPVENNWPDLRDPAGRPSFLCTWCHGAPGIGLARASGLHLHDCSAARRDIDRAVAAVRRHGLGAKDGLCCGNLGRAELLVMAGERAAGGRGEIGPGDLAAAVIGRWAQPDDGRGDGKGDGPVNSPVNGPIGGVGVGMERFTPSLFTGMAGIGYELLRIARPNQVPSVLAWE